MMGLPRTASVPRSPAATHSVTKQSRHGRAWGCGLYWTSSSICYHGWLGAGALHTPVAMLETERLLLRPLTIADIDEFVALHDDADVTRFIRRLDRPAAEERIQSIEREWLER